MLRVCGKGFFTGVFFNLVVQGKDQRRSGVINLLSGKLSRDRPGRISALGLFCADLAALGPYCQDLWPIFSQ